MHRNPYEISSIWSLIIMVVLLSGTVSVLIPLMSGDLPHRQGDAQFLQPPRTQRRSQTGWGHPQSWAEAAGKSDGTFGHSSKSTPVVSIAPCSPAPYTHGYTFGVSGAAESAGAFSGFPRYRQYTSGRNSFPYAYCRPANPDCILDSAAASGRAQNSRFLLTRRHLWQPPLQFRRTCRVTCPTHRIPTPPARPRYPSPRPRWLELL